MNLNNDHNVYILGAGFSREAGLPLISDFLTQMRDSHEWLIHQGRKEQAAAVEEVLAFRLEAASAAYWVTLDLENIEELFSLASTVSNEVDRHIRTAIAATLDFARETHPLPRQPLRYQGKSALFGTADPNANTPAAFPPWAHRTPQSGAVTIHPYTYYVARLLGMLRDGKQKGQNSFITFNYDTILEDPLLDLRQPFTYGFAASDQSPGLLTDENAGMRSIPVLKLHGSINWARRGTADNLRAPLRFYKSYQELFSHGQEPALVPPTWKKVFGGHLEVAWDTAVKTLNSATRIIVIGFSIPPTDSHFKYLMAAGLQNNISLRQVLFIKPDATEDLKPRVQKLLKPAYIDSNLIEFESSTLALFLRAHAGGPGRVHAIGRPVETEAYVTI